MQLWISIMDIHNAIMDIHNYRVYALLAFHMSQLIHIQKKYLFKIWLGTSLIIWKYAYRIQRKVSNEIGWRVAIYSMVATDGLVPV